MKPAILFFLILINAAIVHAQTKNKTSRAKSSSVCSEECLATNKTKTLSCKLMSAELQERKATVLAGLRKQIKERKELRNGYAFRFDGSDNVVDELTSFIKTERNCCDFFIFNLSISGDKSDAWLEITGPKGAKDFITGELEL
ncbi:MAG: hypothetical protein ACM3H8_15620 [Sphingobacteriales bacterium]